MSSRRRSAAWTAFSKRRRGHAHLKIDPLYSVPTALIDAVCTHAPDFWTDDDIAFERDLTATAGGGFFNQRPFRCPLSSSSDPSTAASGEAVRNLEMELLTEQGLNQLQIDAHRRRREEQRQHADQRALAYSGWLVSNTKFLTERDQLRERYADWVQNHGSFPSETISLLGERPPRTDRDEAHFLLFLRRWGLRTLITWDLPQPMRLQSGVVVYPEVAGSADAGVSVFLPWYVLRDREIDVHELTGWVRTLVRPSHLSGWLDHEPGKKNLGHVRWKNLFALYCGWTLALAARYPGQVAGNRERLDRAFGAYLGVGVDSVKKLRRELASASASDE